MKYTIPDLPYAYDALEPYVDTETMKIHHTKHHQTYVDKLNESIESSSEKIEDAPIETILAHLESLPKDVQQKIKNFGGGHYNHSIFWEMLSPNKDQSPEGILREHIEKNFESFEKFKEQFTKSAVGLFGSGWAWLVYKDNALHIITTQNQDSPINEGVTPLLGIDVWEHAYYLKFQNKRADFIESWWHVVNWRRVEELFKKML